MAVSELLDGEVSSDELQQSASLLYDVIHDLDIANAGPVFNQKRYDLSVLRFPALLIVYS